MPTLIRKNQIENLGITSVDIAANAGILTSQLADGITFIRRNGSVAFAANQSMGGFRITNLGVPVSGTDAARLVDIQNAQIGVNGKDAAKVTTTINITLSGVQTIDGISLIAGDRILVKNQTIQADNGIYVVAAGIWNRSEDANSALNFKSGAYVFVNEGTVNADTGWLLSTDGNIVIGTTALTFIQFTGAGQIIEGNGITKTGNTISAKSANTGRIIINGSGIDLAQTGISAGTYTKLTIDIYGRVTAAEVALPSDINAQPANTNLTALSGVSTTGIYVITASGAATTRIITGTTGNILVSNGSGVSGNPVINLATTAVTAGDYKGITVDSFGRVTQIVDLEDAFVSRTKTVTKSGIMTFSSSPIVPNAINDNQAVAFGQLRELMSRQINLTAHTLLSTIHNYCFLKVKANINVTVPVDLPDNFNCVFYCWPSGKVTFLLADGTTQTWIAPRGTILNFGKMATFIKDANLLTYVLEGELTV